MNPRTFLSTAATFLVVALCARAYAELPKGTELARYQPMMERSPFAVATVVATPPPAPTFAKELFIANAAKLEDKAVVTLNSSTDKNFREYLTTDEPSQNGYSIVDIQWSDRVGETKVTIAKDGNTATLSFNQALISQPLNSGIVPGVVPQIPQQSQMIPQNQFQQGQQGVTAIRTEPAMPQPVVTPATPGGVPPLPTPPPRTRAVIQRNPAANVPQQQPGGNVGVEVPETH
jgi:hypothetical protein